MREKRETKNTVEKLKDDRAQFVVSHVPAQPPDFKKGQQIVSTSGAFIPVAKERMMCPFSNRLCEECALYRGKHYYLCFCQKYRGYLGESGDGSKEDSMPVPGARSNEKFEIPLPSQIPTRAIDPFVINRKSHKKED